jgi:hypothetical protein
VVDQPGVSAPPAANVDRDEQQLAELGYKQELSRAWSGFTNFAISFTIISVLAGTFTAFPFAWQNGGPIAVSIGWPVLCFFVLMVGLPAGLRLPVQWPSVVSLPPRRRPGLVRIGICPTDHMLQFV